MLAGCPSSSIRGGSSVAVEQPFAVRSSTRRPARSSTAILPERDAEGLVVVDLKTSARKYTDLQVEASLKLSVYSYAASMNGLADQDDVRLRFDVLTKTKQPELHRYWTTRDRAANVRLFRLAAEVLRAIEAGVFHPIVGWQCKECPLEQGLGVGVGQPNSVVRTTMVIAFAHIRRGRSPGRPSTRCGTIRVIDMATTQVTPAAFVQTLRDEVMGHAAVTHPFLHRFAQGGLAAWQLWGYASQHYQLVCFFTAYLEALTQHTPDQEIRRLVQEILEEEYMRPQHFERSHPALYRRFMRAVGFREGEWDQIPALPATRAFVVMHLDMTLRSWLETLGAVGPGHEWAIPRMFPPLVQGIERSVALDPSALEYFRLHIDLDVKHGQMLEQCLNRWAGSEAHRDEIRRGALRSLEARAVFWSALAEQLFQDAGR